MGTAHNRCTLLFVLCSCILSTSGLVCDLLFCLVRRLVLTFVLLFVPFVRNIGSLASWFRTSWLWLHCVQLAISTPCPGYVSSLLVPIRFFPYDAIPVDVYCVRRFDNDVAIIDVFLFDLFA